MIQNLGTWNHHCQICTYYRDTLNKKSKPGLTIFVLHIKLAVIADHFYSDLIDQFHGYGLWLVRTTNGWF